MLGEPEGQVFRALADLRRRGARIALDDFGMGYGGLRHLAGWPVDVLKIDRHFVRDLGRTPRDGAVMFQGRNLVGDPAFRVAKAGLGYVPEDRRIFTDLTVEENLKVGAPRGRMTAGWSPERIYGVFPNLAEMRNRRANQMSGGEQQMLTLARTLMGAPKMMLVDEPSEGLAPVIVQQMAGMLKALRDEGVTILLSEQNMFFAAEVATHAFIIEKGEIRFDGPIRSVLEDEALRAAYLAV